MAGPNVSLTADNKRFIAAMEQASGSVGKFAANVNIKLAKSFRESDWITQNFEKGIGRVADRVKTAGTTLTAGVSAPLAALGGVSYSTFGDIDALERSLSQYGVTLKEVKELAKLPGLGLEEAASSLTALLSVRFNADLARRAMIGFGNALVQTGKGKAELDGINLALTQMKGKGKISAEEINQIAERLPMIRDLMQKAFGTADTEVLQKMNISADQFLEKITIQLEKLPKAIAGPKAITENFFDSIKVGSYEVGKALERNFSVSSKIEGLGESIDGLSQSFARLDPAVQKNILLATGFAASLGPISLGVGSLMSATPTLIKGFTFLTSTTVLATAAIAAAAGGLYSLYNTYNPNILAASKLVDTTKEVTEATNAELLKVREMVAVAGDDKKSKEERKSALDRLKATYPDYFGKLDAEKLKTQDLKVAYDGLYDSIIKAAGARAAQSRLEKLSSEQFDDSDRLNVLRSQLKEAVQASKELSNVDIAMGNPVGTSTQASVSFISAQIRNVKNQIEERKQAMRALAGLANIETPALKPITIPQPKVIAPKIDLKKIGYVGALDISMSSLADPVEAVKKKLKPMIDYYTRMSDQTQKQMADGLKMKALTIEAPKIELDLTQAMNSIRGGLNPLAENLRITWASFQDSVDSLLSDDKRLGNAFTSVFESIGANLNEKGGFKNILKTFTGLIGDFLIQIGQQMLVAAAALLNPLTAPITGAFATQFLGGAGLVVAGAAIKATKFAEGGVVKSPTFAMFGEYPGAFTNPEIAGRFDQFKGMLQPLFKEAVYQGQMTTALPGVGQSITFVSKLMIDSTEMAQVVNRGNRFMNQLK